MAVEAPTAPPPAAPAPSAPAAPRDLAPDRKAGASSYGALDALAADDGEPEPQAASPTSKAMPRRSDGTFDKKEAHDDPPKDTEVATEQPKEAEKSAEKPVDATKDQKGSPTPREEDEDKLAPKALRELAKTRKQKLAALEKEYNEFKAKSSTPHEDPEKKTLIEKTSAYEKKLAAIEDELRFTAYERSSEYKDKYEKPYVDAWMDGQAVTAGLRAIEKKDAETGEVIRPARKGTPEDFDRMMTFTNDSDAADWAVDNFGNAAQILINHRENVRRMNSSKNKALEEFKKNGSEREKQRSEQMRQEQERFTNTLNQFEKEDVEKYPMFFKPHETDTADNEAFENGKYIVERVKASGAPIREGDKPWSPQEYARGVATVRMKAAAFDRLAYRLGNKIKQLKELRTKLAQYEDSGAPGKGDTRDVKQTNRPQRPSIGGALAALDKDYASSR